MSKKKVISDFGDLKGKISFSEASGSVPVAEPSEVLVGRAGKARETKQGELHVGQSVVLMDSDLRGKIVQLGKKVTIELEDGLVIEAAYGEFAVTSDAEISALKETKAKSGKKSENNGCKRTKSTAKAELTIDLHIEAIPGGRSVPKGQHLQFQMDTFRRAIKDNMRHKGMKITFIHGIGDGTLKAAIRKELDEVYALRCSYSVGDPAVTTVTII
jgi:hypothetical protein